MAMDKIEPPRVVTPSEHFEFSNPFLMDLLRSYGCLIAMGDDGFVQAKGTAFFVEIDGQKVLVTARHVALAEGLQDREWLLMVAPRNVEHGVVTDAEVFRFRGLQVVWESVLLDVAVLLPPDGLIDAEGYIFLPGERDARTTTEWVRKIWRERTSETTALPIFVLGFPNFGHLVDRARGTEQPSALPMIAYLRQLDDSPWSGMGRFAPQMSMEIEASNAREYSGDLKNLAEKFVENMGAKDKEPFGGYSGGPVVYVAANGVRVIGTVREGRSYQGAAGPEFVQVFASVWDDVVTALRASSAWNAFLASRDG
ncbi:MULTISPECIES: hypothetical protein [Corallococcus]|uniref:hypothetical protein n=1 Tax=Corallococcus TaxID=83461 RepID=UPI0011C410D8|nr:MULTISPECIES: hypothetical protein [Corallococcus]NRD51907.1 hypothetical protein [Corallococcus exiguus]